MVRTKNANIRDDEEAENYTDRYNCPFELFSELEGTIFQKFNESEITPPHYLDWELIGELQLDQKVGRYLRNLGMETYARTVNYSGYDPLCYEFLTSMTISGDKKRIKARMNEREYHISLARMKAVFGFSTSGASERPPSFNAHAVWTDLTGFNNWNNSGMSNGFIRDPALAIVHKFLAYNVSGKEQANKVNANEVFLLSCAVNGTKVCISQFIWAAMTQMQKRSSSHASFCPIVTGLAYQFGVFTETSGDQDGQDELEPEFIDFSELKGAQLISDRFTIVPHERRHCVVTYINTQIAAGRRHPTAAGPSGAGGDNEEEENEEEDQEEEEEEEEEGNGDQPAGGSMSGDYYQQFRPHFDSSMGAFQTHFDSSMGAFQTHFDSSMGALRNDMNARFDAQDEQMKELQRQWDAWMPRK